MNVDNSAEPSSLKKRHDEIQSKHDDNKRAIEKLTSDLMRLQATPPNDSTYAST